MFRKDNYLLLLSPICVWKSSWERKRERSGRTMEQGLKYTCYFLSLGLKVQRQTRYWDKMNVHLRVRKTEGMTLREMRVCTSLTFIHPSRECMAKSSLLLSLSSRWLVWEPGRKIWEVNVEEMSWERVIQSLNSNTQVVPISQIQPK